MKLIKLTKKDDQQSIFVNADKIETFCAFEACHRMFTAVVFGFDDYVNVIETPQEIMSKIQRADEV